jgi:hypothetical protein
MHAKIIAALPNPPKIESTARYLRIAKRSDPIAIARAFDIRRGPRIDGRGRFIVRRSGTHT